jgi:hypothetical protein
LGRSGNDATAALLLELNTEAEKPEFREELTRALKGKAQGKFANDEERNRFVDLLLAVVVSKNSALEEMHCLCSEGKPKERSYKAASEPFSCKS